MSCRAISRTARLLYLTKLPRRPFVVEAVAGQWRTFAFAPGAPDFLFVYADRFTSGGCQVPLPGGKIEGGSIFGQYKRITR